MGTGDQFRYTTILMTTASIRFSLLSTMLLTIACTASGPTSTDAAVSIERAEVLEADAEMDERGRFDCLGGPTTCTQGWVCSPEQGYQPRGDNSCGCYASYRCTDGCAPEFWVAPKSWKLEDFCAESIPYRSIGSFCDEDGDCAWPKALMSDGGTPENVYRKCQDSKCVESSAPERPPDGTECRPRLERPCGEASVCVQATGSTGTWECRHRCSGDHQCELGLVCNLTTATCYEP
jgi:hypothetical protein